METSSARLRFVAYRSAYQPRGTVGLLDHTGAHVTAILDRNGTSLANLHVLIESWDEFSQSLDSRLDPREENIDCIEVLAPLRGRDVLAVGYNYKEHHNEFKSSGFDNSLKDDYPKFPIIFTKRATSIIPNGATIYPHPNVTSKLDYEGELGIIIGKGGLGIKKEDAWLHVWGACIINDVTARDRQRDHKQFYIGKSLDTFCPMGPIAVHGSELNFDKMLLETRVNGKVVQSQNTNELIFDIPTLIETCSAGITLQPGDVIATGTPEGVGARTQTFLGKDDVVEIAISGLGRLSNPIGDPAKPPPSCTPLWSSDPSPAPSAADDCLVMLRSGPRHVEVSGHNEQSSPTIMFIHGLGGSSSNWYPLIQLTKVEERFRVVRFDFAGHGNSPAGGVTESIDSLVQEVEYVLDHIGAENAILVAHSMGGLVATSFAAKYPRKVSKLVLLGPVRGLSEPIQKALNDRGSIVSSKGMAAVARTVTTAGTAGNTRANKPIVTGYILSSLLSTSAAGYAAACRALAAASNPDYGAIASPTLIVAGDEDKTSPQATIDFIHQAVKDSKVQVMEQCGHWHMLEAVDDVAKVLGDFVG